MGFHHETPGMLKTQIQWEVVPRYEDDERMPGHDDSKTVVGWNPNPAYCGRTVKMRPTGLGASKREPGGGASVAATDPWHASTKTRTGCVGHKLRQKAEEK